MAYRAVFFDLDDTLYPYPPCNEAGKRAAWETAQELGYELDREDFDSFYQAGRRETKRELPGTAASHERFLYFKRAVEEHAGTSRAGDALRLGEAYWSAYVDAMESFEGVSETLAGLREAGLDLALVSNLTTRVQLWKLDALGLADAFDHVLTSEELLREKPGAGTFAIPLARLDLRPSEVLMVGNDPEKDVGGANAVGLDTALFNCDETDLDGLEAPDHRLDSFPWVLEVVA